LNSYCARLIGLSPPLATLSGWTRPLGKKFLMSTQAKVAQRIVALHFARALVHCNHGFSSRLFEGQHFFRHE
jgi:hypothetical protein